MAVLDECAESDHCPLTLELMLQASAPTASQIDGYPQAPSTVTIDKIIYDKSRKDVYRDNLLTLLDSLFIDPDPQCCLASALQFCIAQAALKLTSFGRPRKHFMQKVKQNWWYDAECKSAQTSLRQLSEDLHEHAVELKSCKQLLRRTRHAWERKAQQILCHKGQSFVTKEQCEMASRNPQSFWRQYKERQSSKCNIPKEQWKASLEALYKAPKAPAAASADDASAVPVNPSQSPTPDVRADA